jgi:toxin ParE1/3/4
VKPAVFHRLARAELDAAMQWHQEQRHDLGLALLEEVRRTVTRIQSNTLAGERYKQTNLRSLPVRRFPYVIYYLEQDDFLWIAAVAHVRRRPGYWRRRKP